MLNLRGTHGSGKSTIVRGLLDANAARPIYGTSARRPEAYRLNVSGKTTFVIGPYQAACGGCDAIRPFALITQLIEKYAATGSVVFERASISSCWGEIGRLMERWSRDAIVLFLDTPADECVRRVKERRAERGDGRAFDPKNLIQKHDAISRLKQKLDAAGVVRTAIASSAADLLLLMDEKRLDLNLAERTRPINAANGGGM